MKKAISLALAALALAVVAAPETQANEWGWRGDVYQRLSGHAIIVEDLDAAGNTTSTINGIAKGKRGSAQVTAVLVYESPSIFDDPRCPAEFPIGGNVFRFEWGETYNDGSLLAGYVPEVQALCTDGIETVADLTGLISGGTGRFEGASGTWRIEASSPTANTNTTGTITVELE